jgi:hypothetical protein
MRAIRSTLHFSGALAMKPRAAGLKSLGVRWRPALAENPKTQKSHALGSGAGTENDFGLEGM